jgi:hypothetical protein
MMVGTAMATCDLFSGSFIDLCNELMPIDLCKVVAAGKSPRNVDISRTSEDHQDAATNSTLRQD